MGMSFFNHALTKTSREAASHQCHSTSSWSWAKSKDTLTKYLEDNDELLVHTVWSGTLSLLLEGMM